MTTKTYGGYTAEQLRFSVGKLGYTTLLTNPEAARIIRDLLDAIESRPAADYIGVVHVLNGCTSTMYRTKLPDGVYDIYAAIAQRARET